MSCNLQDPKILQAYNEIIDYEPTDWLILGYNDTRDVVSLYDKGTNGLSEFRDHLKEEVLFGFLRLDDRFILITYISEQVSGVRRARALVHGRAVATLMPVHNAQMTATMPSELSDTNIHTKLKVGENRVPGKSTTRPQSMSKRNSMRIQSSSAPSSPTPQEYTIPSPESGISEEPEIIEHEDAAQAEQRYQEELRQQQEEREAQEKMNELERIRQEKEEEHRRLVALAEEQKRREQAEQERRAAQEAAERQARELAEQRQREAVKRQLEDSERNGSVLLSGYVSVQNEQCPFWKRRFFTISGSNMLLYRDASDKNHAQVLTLSPSTTAIRSLTGDYDIIIPNAIQVRVHGGYYSMFVDSKQEADLLVTALRKAAGIAI